MAKNRKHAAVYHGRYKGSSETHMPNDTFRENYDDMHWPSHVYYTCPECGLIRHGTKMEMRIYNCPCLEPYEEEL